jgi:lysine/ornithine N-monooxygenase
VLNQELNLLRRLNSANTNTNEQAIYNQLNTLHKRRNQVFNTFKQKKHVAEQYIDYLGWLNKQAKSSNYNRKMNATKKRNQVQAKLNALVRTRKRRA